MKKHFILLVDDHPMLRQGLKDILESEADLKVCGEAGTAQEALQRIEELGPDLVIVDISLGGNNGLELTKQIRETHPHVKVMVFSMHDETVYAQRALRAGALAYLMKQEKVETIKAAARRALGGEIFVSERVSKQLLHQIVNGRGATVSSPVDVLSDRELEVLQLLGEGKSTRQVAEQLYVSVKTIESHRANIKEKLGLRNSAELIQFAVQWVEHEKAGARATDGAA